MSAAERSTEPSSLTEPVDVRERIGLALFAFAVLASVPFLLHPWYGFHQDASTYIIAARSLAAGHGYSYLGEPFGLRPPGLSALLAPVIATLGTHFRALNGVILLSGAAGAIALYGYARPRLGTVLGLLVAAALWLAPGYQALATQVLSDVPGLTLALACLLLDRWAQRRPGVRRDVLLGVAIGLAAYLRTSVILLVPAIAAARLCAHVSSRGTDWFPLRGVLAGIAIVGLAATAVQMPWAIRNRLNPAPAPADQTMVHDYATGMWHEDAGDPASRRVPIGAIAARSIKRIPMVLGTLGDRLRNSGGDARLVLGAACLASILIALIRRREAAEFYAVANLAVVLVYFAYDARLLLPIFALGLVAGAETLRDGLRLAVGERRATVITGAVIVVMIAIDVDPRSGWDEIERANQLFSEQAAVVAEALPEQAVLATFYGRHWEVFLDRPVYSLRWASSRALRRQTRPEDAREAIIDKYGIDTVILSTHSKREQALIPEFTRRYGAAARFGPVHVFRVRDGAS